MGWLAERRAAREARQQGDRLAQYQRWQDELYEEAINEGETAKLIKKHEGVINKQQRIIDGLKDGTYEVTEEGLQKVEQSKKPEEASAAEGGDGAQSETNPEALKRYKTFREDLDNYNIEQALVTAYGEDKAKEYLTFLKSDYYEPTAGRDPKFYNDRLPSYNRIILDQNGVPAMEEEVSDDEKAKNTARLVNKVKEDFDGSQEAGGASGSDPDPAPAPGSDPAPAASSSSTVVASDAYYNQLAADDTYKETLDRQRENIEKQLQKKKGLGEADAEAILRTLYAQEEGKTPKEAIESVDSKIKLLGRVKTNSDIYKESQERYEPAYLDSAKKVLMDANGDYYKMVQARKGKAEADRVLEQDAKIYLVEKKGSYTPGTLLEAAEEGEAGLSDLPDFQSRKDIRQRYESHTLTPSDIERRANAFADSEVERQLPKLRGVASFKKVDDEYNAAKADLAQAEKALDKAQNDYDRISAHPKATDEHKESAKDELDTAKGVLKIKQDRFNKAKTERDKVVAPVRNKFYTEQHKKLSDNPTTWDPVTPDIRKELLGEIGESSPNTKRGGRGGGRRGAAADNKEVREDDRESQEEQARARLEQEQKNADRQYKFELTKREEDKAIKLKEAAETRLHEIEVKAMETAARRAEARMSHLDQKELTEQRQSAQAVSKAFESAMSMANQFFSGMMNELNRGTTQLIAGIGQTGTQMLQAGAQNLMQLAQGRMGRGARGRGGGRQA